MDLRRLRAGEWLLTLSGAALFVSLFLDWYASGPTGVSGWQAFSVIDGILAAVALLALIAVVLAATQPTPALSISLEALTVLFGLLAVVLAVIRVLDKPDLPAGYDLAVGAWVGLIASVGVFASALIAIRDERLDPGTDATGKPVSAQPEAELLTLPREGA
jgi:hypothetical protein